MLRLAAGSRRIDYRTYMVFLLATVFALSGLDGTALGLLLPSIKASLHLTDTELGVLTGIAFSVFYSTFGIFIGRWADYGDRGVIIALTTALWGLMVMLVGAISSFGGLLTVRVGVAVGEAGCIPVAYSLIGDYFTREERPRAISNYLLGGQFSIILGYLLAGWLNDHYGWRAVFVCIGMPSVIVAGIAWWTLSEPRRSAPNSSLGACARARPPPLLSALRMLWRSKTFRFLLASFCVNAIFGFGIFVWQPSFFSRSYGIQTEQLGLDFALIAGVGGMIGLYGGGHLASRFAPRNERLQLRVFSLANAGCGVASALIYLVREPATSMALLGVAVVVGSLENGPVFAAIQAVTPDRVRAFSFSLAGC